MRQGPGQRLPASREEPGRAAGSRAAPPSLTRGASRHRLPPSRPAARGNEERKAAVPRVHCCTARASPCVCPRWPWPARWALCRTPPGSRWPGSGSWPAGRKGGGAAGGDTRSLPLREHGSAPNASRTISAAQPCAAHASIHSRAHAAGPSHPAHELALHMMYDRMAPLLPISAPTVVSRSFCSMNPSAHSAYPL